MADVPTFVLLLINQEVVKWEFVHPPSVWHQMKSTAMADFHVALFVSGSWYWAGFGPPVAGHSNRTEPIFLMSLVTPGLLLLWHIKLSAIGPLPVGLRAFNQLSSLPVIHTEPRQPLIVTHSLTNPSVVKGSVSLSVMISDFLWPLINAPQLVVLAGSSLLKSYLLESVQSVCLCCFHSASFCLQVWNPKSCCHMFHTKVTDKVRRGWLAY